jgi:hypothetical protein
VSGSWERTKYRVLTLRGKHTPKTYSDVGVVGASQYGDGAAKRVLDRVTQLKSIDTMLCRVVENAQNTMSSLRGKQTPKNIQ